jgi:hypothetical protein
MIEQRGSIDGPSEPEIEGVRPDMGQSWGNPIEGDDVEGALARALDRAAAAGRFDVVAQLARELEARRLSTMPNVLKLAGKARPKG